MATKEGPVLAANRQEQDQEQEQAVAAAWPNVTMSRRQSPYKGCVLQLIPASQAS